MSDNPTTRFTDRVENYVRYRPGYPVELLVKLAALTQLSTATSIVTDIGSGTGILSAQLFAFAKRVYAVEPNAAMRAAAERGHISDSRFVSIDGTAENTTLPDHLADLITAGQSFHWFKHEVTRREFTRILKPGGFVALIWNEREITGTQFLEKYNAILNTLAPDYAQSRHTLVSDAAIAAFFSPASFQRFEFPTEQLLDLDGLIGRALSSSYAPNPRHPNHESFIASLKNLFGEESRNGCVVLRYQARLYLGNLE